MIGCPDLAELQRQIGTLKVMIRVNALRWNPRLSHADIDAQIEDAIGAPVPAGTEIPKIAAAAWTAGYHSAERALAPPFLLCAKPLSAGEKDRLHDLLLRQTGHVQSLQPVEIIEAPNSRILLQLHRICREYEQGGFSSPGRAIDDIRDALGRMADGFADEEARNEGQHEETQAPARAAAPEEPEGGAAPQPAGGADGQCSCQASAEEGAALQQPKPQPASDNSAARPLTDPTGIEIARRAELAAGSTPELNSLIHAAFGRQGWSIAEWVSADRELRQRGAPCPSIMDVPDYMGSLDAGRSTLPGGCFLRIGNDGEGPDPSLYLAELVGPMPACERVAARALTMEGALVSASLRLLASTSRAES